MIIGMLLDETFPPDPRVENEALTLIAAGHEVHLYCLGMGQPGNEREDHQGIQVHRYGVPGWMHSISALAYTIPYYHRRLRSSVEDFLRQSKAEVLHVHDMRIARAVFDVNCTYNLPVVLDLHENRPEIMKHYAHVKSLAGKILIYPSLWKRWEYEYIRRADRVIVVTEAAKTHYVKQTKKTGTAITVVPNTVRREFYQNPTLDQRVLEQYSNDFVLLYLGDTGLRRGLKTAIAAMPSILDAVPDARLVIVGNSKDDDKLMKCAQNTGVSDRIDLLGWQSFSLFPSFIEASNVGICPLHRNLHHDTTYANKVFQSLAFGKPVIVSDCTAQAELAETYDCGLVFKAKDVAAFATAAIQMATDKVSYERQAQNARKAVEDELRWEIYAKELVGVYARPFS